MDRFQKPLCSHEIKMNAFTFLEVFKKRKRNNEREAEKEG